MTNDKGKRKKGKCGRRGQWLETCVDDLVDIILENDKLKEKLLMTNVKNVKNSQYYSQVIEEIKRRCAERGEEFKFNVHQTRQKFKRCVSMCRSAAMKIKTASGIKRFQEDKELGNWFGRLLPVISSMDHCQPEQAIEPGIADNDEEYEETSISPADLTPNSQKRKSYVPEITPKRKTMKTETILGEIKEAMGSMKQLASDSSSKEILDFLKEESKRQSERDATFFQLMTTLLQPQQNQTPISPIVNYQPNYSMARPANLSFNSSNRSPNCELHQAHSSQSFFPERHMNDQFRPVYERSNSRVSSTITRPSTTSPDLPYQVESFTQQLTDPNFP